MANPPANERPHLTPYLWWIWSLAGMGILLDGFDLFVIAMALPLLIQDWGISGTLAALLAAAAPAGAVLGALWVGPIIDRIGRRRVLLLCPFLFVVATAACALAPSFWPLLTARFVLGMGIGADYPLSASYVAEFMPAPIRGRMMVAAFSFQSIGALLGALVSVMVLVLMPSIHSWRWMLGLGVVPALVVWISRLRAPESPLWKRPSSARSGGQICDVPHWRQKLALVTLPWFILDVVLYGVGLFSPAVLVMAYQGLGLSSASTAKGWLPNDLVAAANTVVLDLFWVFGFVLAIVLVERWGRCMLQSMGFLGMAGGLALACWGSATLPLNIPLLLLGVALSNLCSTMGPNATTYLLPAELFPTEVRGTAHGIASAVAKLGAVSSAVALPAMASLGMEGTFAIGAGLCLFAALLTLVLGEETTGLQLDATT
jgi:MFS family permease